MSQSTSETLSLALADVLETWRSRESGERDPFYWIVRLSAARAHGDDTRELALVPAAFRADVAARHRDVGVYFDNVRYALLDPMAAVWGTVVNSLRVAAGVPSVTVEQRRVFDVPVESLLAFFRSAHEHATAADRLHDAFRPMPAPDCQALAALLHPNASIDGKNLVALVRMIAAEGPITAAESEALAVLSSTGLSQVAFRGTRRDG